MSAMHERIPALLAREPFEPFVIETNDGRRIAVRERNRVVLNAIAVSVVEEAFSVTVIGLDQVTGISFPEG